MGRKRRFRKCENSEEFTKMHSFLMLQESFMFF